MSEFTSGNLIQNILDLSWPSMVSMALATLPSILDSAWMGRLGAQAIAAAGIGMALRVTMISPLMALSASAGAVVARYVGAREQDKANLAVLQAVVLFAFTSVSIGLLGLALLRPLLELAGATGEVLPLAASYVRILFLGLISMEMVPSVGFMLVAAGSPHLSLRVNLLVSAIILISEPILVLGIGSWPGLGVAGGSLAMVSANTVGMIYALYLLLTRSASAWIDLQHLALDWGMIKRIVRIAAPAVVQRGVPNLANSLLLRLMAAYGTTPLAAFSIVGRLFNFALIPAMGISRSAAALVGQNLGARQPDRAERGANYIGIGVLIISVLMIGLAIGLRTPLLGLFTSDAGVMVEGAKAIFVLGLGQLFFATSLAFENSLTGAGDTVSPMVINMVFLWIIEIPLVFLFSRAIGWGAMGIWWAIAAAMAVRSAMTLFRFRQGRWKTQRI